VVSHGFEQPLSAFSGWIPVLFRIEERWRIYFILFVERFLLPPARCR